MSAPETILDGRLLDWPQDWDSLFGRSAPLVLEIGFGRGDFLIRLAQTHADANVIGIEVSQPSLRKAARKRRTQGLSNLILLYGSAPHILTYSVAPGVLGDVHINFPDPWPKEGHHSRRLINPAFIYLLATRMRSSARLFIATDHPDYQPVVTDCLAATPFFDSLLPTIYVTDDETRYRTKYEMKALAEGRTCQYYKFVRNALPAPDLFPIPEEMPMPHAVIRTPLTLADIADRFEPTVCSDEDAEIHVRLMRVYDAVGEPVLLVETHINQKPQPQRVALKIHMRQSGELMLSLHEIGFPRPTTGVQAAVACLLRYLQSLSSETVVVQHNLRL